MPRFYVFPDQASAQKCVDRIDARATEIYRMQGFTEDASGGFISKDTAGKDILGAVTETFAIPRQRVDGKWVVPTTDTAPYALTVIAALVPPVTVAVYVAQDIGTLAPVEQSNSSWWPAPPKLEGAP